MRQNDIEQCRNLSHGKATNTMSLSAQYCLQQCHQ